MKYPKVLLISQIFDKSTGPGITITNLFRHWPYDNIAIISSKKNENWSLCGLQYLLGDEEKVKIWPFSLLQDHSVSRIIRMDKNENLTIANSYKIEKKNNYKYILKIFIKKILNYFGIFLLLNKIYISESLSKFIYNFKPDIIYTQLSSIEIIRFVDEINQQYGIPIAIHIMDDWPAIVHKKGLLGFYWNRKTNLLFQKLIKKSSVLMTISDAMSVEYKHRYGFEWLSFHNPVENIFLHIDDSDDFEQFSKKNRILYLGRIGIANEESIIFIINAIIKLNIENHNIEFYLYTRDYNNKKLIKFFNNRWIKILPDVPHSAVPSLLRKASVLILPLDFNKFSKRFARFSMPTKATEYMASGVPVLVFAPSGNAMTEYARDSGWGYVVDKKDMKFLQKGILDLFNNRDLRTKLVKNAKETIIKNHVSENVRNNFRKTLLLNNTK